MKVMVVIAEQSFWFKKSVQESVLDASDQFKKQALKEKLKTRITSETLQVLSNKKELLKFLYK